MKATLILFIFISSLISKSLSIEGNMKEGFLIIQGLSKCKDYEKNESVYVNQICIGEINVDYKISTLLGEPTRIFKVNWEIANIRINGRPYFLRELSPEIQKIYKKIRIISPTFFNASYEVNKRSGLGWKAIGNGLFRFSGDYIGQSGQTGFSVTGSPSWDKLFIDEYYPDCNTERDETRYFDENSAKKLFLNHLIKKEYMKSIHLANICSLTFSGISELNRAISKECKFNEKACEKEEKKKKIKDKKSDKVLNKNNVIQKLEKDSKSKEDDFDLLEENDEDNENLNKSNYLDGELKNDPILKQIRKLKNQKKQKIKKCEKRKPSKNEKDFKCTKRPYSCEKYFQLVLSTPTSKGKSYNKIVCKSIDGKYISNPSNELISKYFETTQGRIERCKKEKIEWKKNYSQRVEKWQKAKVECKKYTEKIYNRDINKLIEEKSDLDQLEKELSF